jgi:hypothetical protein
MRRQDAGANIRVANGPKGTRQESRVIQLLVLLSFLSSLKCRASTRPAGERVTFFACAKKGNQRNTPPAARLPGIRQLLLRCSTSGIHAVACPPGPRGRYGVRWMYVHVHSANGRASCAASCGLILRTLAAPQGALVGRHPAAEARAGQSRAKPSVPSHIEAVQGCTDSWIPAPFAVPSIAGVAGESPQGRGDGSPRLRSSTWMYCLSNPAATRSAGQFDSHDANRTTASGA